MQKRGIKRWKDGRLVPEEDWLAEEAILHVEINEQAGFDTIITPEDIREFVYGNLFTEGLIEAPEELASYTQRAGGDSMAAIVEIRGFEDKKSLFRRNYNIIWTGCGGSPDFYKRLGDRFERLDSGFRMEPRKLLDVPKKASGMTEEFKLTGAYHYAFLFDSGGEYVAHAYDIGRHNAVDKVVGARFLAGQAFSDVLLYVTGRITADIVLKCVRARIPLVVSRTAPLLQTVRMAEEYNLGVIGFLRGGRFNLYTDASILEEG
jgi:FdhD protein